MSDTKTKAQAEADALELAELRAEKAAQVLLVAQPAGITKIDSRTGLEQTLSQTTWAMLTEADAAHFETKGEVPAKPAALAQ